MISWTKEPPTMPGFYWLRYERYRPEVAAEHGLDSIYVGVVEVCKSLAEGLCVEMPGDDCGSDMPQMTRLGAEWCGPLPCPVET